jgi:ABC-type multidrug transport system ATPase subunit/ABC-type transport system involved in multi-copper enzyme maturation permease subunit
MIVLRRLSKRYGDRPALDGVSLTFRPGEVTVLLGANGAGKSTLLRCLLGITAFDGDVRVHGRDPRRDGRAVRALIGYVPQTGGLDPHRTVAESMRRYPEIRGIPAARGAALLDEAGLHSHASAKVGTLSGGLRQRLSLALALLADPPVLVLDEPGASLDADGRRWLADRLHALARDGRVVIASTHGTDELLAVADRRIVLEAGRVVDARPPAAHEEGPAPAIDAPPAGRLLPLVRHVIADAASNRWLIGYAALLALLGFAATTAGIGGASGLAIEAFGRTTATLMNLCLLVSPLVAVLMGAGAIAGEQDRGTLEYLLAQPLTRTQILIGKYLGLLAALAGATAAGFLPAGVVVAAAAGPGVIPHYLLFPAIAVLVAAAMAGIGLFISVSSSSAVQAQGFAVFAWFGFVLLYDLVLMGTLALSGLSAGWLAALLVLNPIDAARVLGLLALEPDLYLLGPAGAFLAARLSRAGTAVLLLSSLTVWAVTPVVAATVRFAIPPLRRRIRVDQVTETDRAADCRWSAESRGRVRI